MLFLIAENVVFMGISSFSSVILILLLANFLATHIYKTSLPVYKINSYDERKNIDPTLEREDIYFGVFLMKAESI